jgi:hypothetical protein
MEDIYSCTCFCNVQAENKIGPKNDVLFRLPLPMEFGQGGKLCAFNTYTENVRDENSTRPLEILTFVSRAAQLSGLTSQTKSKNKNKTKQKIPNHKMICIFVDISL